MSIRENKYLSDILNSIDCINEFVGKKKLFSTYEKSKMKQAAV